jgi:arylsulfatase A-like enzyme
VEMVFRSLDQNRESRRTLSFFTSDNGLFWGEHGLLAKDRPYRQSLRVPLLMRWPSVVGRGREDPRLTGLIDIAPTIMDVAGVAPNSPLDGLSLLDGAWMRERLLAEGPMGGPIAWASIVGKKYQYVEYRRQETGEVTFREYYDLANDPWQLANLYADADPTNDPPNEETARLSAILARDRRCAGTSGPDACP